MNLLSRRIPTILAILLLTAVAVAGWYVIKNSSPVVSESVKPNKVKITNVADNKFTVSWVTESSTTGAIEYGAVGEKLEKTARDDRDTSATGTYVTHHVTVSDLQPDTQYAFRILSGEPTTRFDNNGSPYAVTTGSTIAVTPTARSVYGDISSEVPAQDVIVYLSLPGAAPVSTLVTSSNKYSFTLSTIRTADLHSYIEYDSQATITNIVVENGALETQVVVTTANVEPVPPIIIGQSADYRNQAVPPIAQVEPQTPDPSPLSSPFGGQTPEPIGIFNIEPLASNKPTGQLDVTLINPSKDGETIATTRPEFRGVGPKDTAITITVHSSQPHAGVAIVEDDGTWSWSPPADLEPGEHTITIAYIDEGGVEQSFVRRFIVSTALAAEGDPSFVATPSAQTSPKASAKASVSPSPKASVKASASPSISPSVREIIPSTESGVPVTGVLTPTVLTAALGFVIMVVGAVLLAL